MSTITADGSKLAEIIFKTIYNVESPAPTATGVATALETPQRKSSGISGGAIAGAVVGLVVGALLIAGACLGFFLWRRRKDDDDLDFEDQFTLSGPEKPVDPPAPSTPNPFLVAGGFNFADSGTNNHGVANTTNLLELLKNHLRATLHGFILVGEHLFTLDGDYHAYEDRQLRPPPEPVRKLSIGLLPEMVARQPGSLKVVNN